MKLITLFFATTALTSFSRNDASADNINWENVTLDHVEQRVAAITGKRVIVEDEKLLRRLITIKTPREMTADEALFFARSVLAIEGIRWEEDGTTIKFYRFLSDDEIRELKKSLGVVEPDVRYEKGPRRARIISPPE